MPLPIFVALVLLTPGGVTLVVRRRNAAACQPGGARGYFAPTETIHTSVSVEASVKYAVRPSRLSR
jgi:hypothetical protein